MSTTIHAEVSKKNPFWIEKHRYYELKHFCLQYDIWKKASNSLLGLQSNPDSLMIVAKSGVSNPTEKSVMAREFLVNRMDLVEAAAKEAGDDLWFYILMGVTKGLPYEILRSRYDIPCCREVYYNMYRKFFWLLNKTRK